LVYGIDGPWGVGKTSFINLAEKQWEKRQLCHCVPLRTSTVRIGARPRGTIDSGHVRRHSREQVFRARVSVNRISLLSTVKGEGDISFFGFKLSLEPTVDTIDDLLDDIDDVLKRIGRRVIIVIDDSTGSTQKPSTQYCSRSVELFKLSQATYVLCYDTENLAGRNDDGEKAREFLEKFVTVKLSLFVDSARIVNLSPAELAASREQTCNRSLRYDGEAGFCLKRGGRYSCQQPSKRTTCLSLVTFRKVKRFVNAMLLMEIEKTDLGRTDFNKRDLINLMLLHLNYPGIFRSIYAEETEGRLGRSR